MKRFAYVTWTGDLKSGKGLFTQDNRTLKGLPFSFASRFENEPQINPEELVGAALASCFSMALSNQISETGKTVKQISTKATVSFESLSQGWTITGILLETESTIPGMDAASFEKIAQQAKETCPVSRALQVPVTLKAKLI